MKKPALAISLCLLLLTISCTRAWESKHGAFSHGSEVFQGQKVKSVFKSYTIGNEEFRSASEALQRQTNLFSNIIKDIKPNQNPVGGTALIAIPSDVEIKNSYINYGINTPQKHIDFAIAASGNNSLFIADAIAKRHIFDSVSVVKHNGNPTSYPMGNSDFMIFNDVDGWFIKGKSKPLIIPLMFDKNKPGGVQRTEAFLDELSKQAQNLLNK